MRRAILPMLCVFAACGRPTLGTTAAGELRATVTDVDFGEVYPGQRVAKGDALLIMEAMKMEHTIRAPAAGSVREFYFRPGDLVDGGAELLAFEARSD